MPLFEWDESMSVGNPEIDRQHQKLMNLLVQAYTASKQHDETQMAAIVDGLQQYTEEHFSYEEALLAKNGYEDLDQHRKIHAGFAEKTRELKSQLYTNLNLTKLFVFLSGWLNNHIQECDGSIRSYMAPETEQDD